LHSQCCVSFFTTFFYSFNLILFFIFVCNSVLTRAGDKDRIRDALEKLKEAMQRYNQLAGDHTNACPEPQKKRALENALKGTPLGWFGLVWVGLGCFFRMGRETV
jgi:hypothetical protein